MSLSNSTLSILVLVSLLVAGGSLALSLGSANRERRLRGRAKITRQADLEGQLEAQARTIERLEAALRQLASGEKRLAETLQGAVQHVGVVRFDAFEDMGGRLSFSAALLDDRGDGVVITSINGRQDTRCYAKHVHNGTSIHNLSEEEEQAIREALSKGRQTVEAS